MITVEPGCYFIDALLLPAMENAQTSKFFNRHEISRFRGFGGVRIESDVVKLHKIAFSYSTITLFVLMYLWAYFCSTLAAMVA